MDLRPPSQCVVLVPIHRNLEPKTEAALWELNKLGYRVQTLRGGSQIDLVRSEMATTWLKEGFQETLWIDADIVFDPKDVGKLRNHNLPFVCGVYPKKSLPPAMACQWKLGDREVIFGPQGGLRELHRCGMGFTLIHARVYQAIRQRLSTKECGGGYEGKIITPYFLPMMGLAMDGKTPAYLSEDYSFCDRAKEAGFIPMADTTIQVRHIGSYEYGWDDFVPKQPYSSIRLPLE